jgi:hypothetical protein
MDNDSGWRFNRNYNDTDQVAEFLPAFLKLLVEIESAGQYRYNDSFKGRIPGIEGPNEDSAIYLLQGLESDLQQAAKVATLIRGGYVQVTHLETPRKFAHIVLYSTRHNGEPWGEFHDARLVPRDDGHPFAVIPKGRRTHGFSVGGRAVLASL